MFAEVAVNLASVRGTFHYHIPESTEFEGLGPGHLVTVPFSGRRAQAIVLRLDEAAPVASTKGLEQLLDPAPVLTRAQLELASWLAAEYHGSLANALALMLPPGLSQRTDSVFRLTEIDAVADDPVSDRLIKLIRRRGPLRGRQIQRSMSRMNWRAAANRLIDGGMLERSSVLRPPQVGARKLRTARLAVPPERVRESWDGLGQTQATLSRRQRILQALIQEGEPLDVTWVYAESGGKLSDLRHLEKLGLVALAEAEVWRDPLEQVEYVPRDAPAFTPDQAQAWQILEPMLDRGHAPLPFLLHGVTGSGKTEIYLRAVAHVLAQGRQAIVLVPEIALTPQTVRRFLARFPGRVGLLHSQLSDGERFDTWRRARAGLLDIVVGPRSALFTPFADIGLIVIDESHDEAYKESERPPRYHARTAAQAYAAMLQAACVLGSATPDLTTVHAARSGEMASARLPARILGHAKRIERQAQRLGLSAAYQPMTGVAVSIEMPPVQIVDMRRELKAGNTSVFSRSLQQQLARTIDAGEQAILFLNRRGRSTYVFCRDCGWVARCPQCDRPLTHHANRQALLCHHCGYQRGAVETCPECGGHRVRHFGAGTERIEETVQRMFPGVSTIRWDADTTRAKGAHDIILAHFQAGRAQVLIGTQMVAKGLDLPLVTFVGVVSADTGLNLPDYRASERTFQLLTQVAGRAGRGLRGGNVVLQTYHPDHYAIQAAARHDFDAFYQDEIQMRQQLSYPPFMRMARLEFRHIAFDRAQAEAEALAEKLRPRLESAGLLQLLIGPVPCFFERVRGEYRWQLVLRAPDPSAFLPDELPTGWSLDIDPVSLL